MPTSTFTGPIPAVCSDPAQMDALRMLLGFGLGVCIVVLLCEYIIYLIEEQRKANGKGDR